LSPTVWIAASALALQAVTFPRAAALAGGWIASPPSRRPLPSDFRLPTSDFYLPSSAF